MFGYIRNERFLVFDLEMTGLSPRADSIIEVGAVPLLGTKPDGELFFSPMQPYTKVSSSSKRIHGLGGENLWNAPPAEVVMTHLFNMMNGRILVGQKPELDLTFLWSAAKNVGGNMPTDWAIDISKLFANVFPDQNSFSLEAMARRIGIKINRKKHNAMQDAIITAKIFSKIIPKLGKKGISLTRELIPIAKTTMQR